MAVLDNKQIEERAAKLVEITNKLTQLDDLSLQQVKRAIDSCLVVQELMRGWFNENHIICWW